MEHNDLGDKNKEEHNTEQVGFFPVDGSKYTRILSIFAFKIGIWFNVCTLATHALEAMFLHTDNFDAIPKLPNVQRANITFSLTLLEKFGIPKNVFNKQIKLLIPLSYEAE